MQNPLVLKTISIIAFIISALFTILLMVSGTVGILSFVLTVGMAIILEVCKVGFFYEALSNTKIMLPIRVLLAVIAFILVGASIFASSSYVQNQANKTKNIQTKQSSQYKQLEEGKALQKDLYNTKQKEIESLEDLKVQQQQEGNNIINSMPKNYIDRKNQQRAETQKQIAKTQELINQKSTELSQIGASLQNPIDTTNLKLNADNGYTAMFQALADYINTSDGYKDSPVNANSLEMFFFIGLGIIFELVAVLTAYLSQLKGNIVKVETLTATNSPQNNNNENSFITTYKPEILNNTRLESDKDKKIIGFQYDDNEQLHVKKCNEYEHMNNGYNPEDLRRYVSYMYSTVKGNVSLGYRTIGQAINIDSEKARKIKGALEQKGIIETVGNKTIVIKDKQEVVI